MNFFKALFGNSEESEEEERQSQAKKQFDLMKFDGVKAMRIGQWDYAVRCFQKALTIKDDLEIHEHLSNAYIRLDQMDEAMAELKHLNEAEPANIDVLLSMAHVAYMKEDYACMASVCKQALTVDPESATAYYQYAQAALGLADVVNGIARLSKALAIKDDYADARLLRAQTLLKMNDLRGASEDCQWLVEHVGEHEDVLMLTARIAHAQGNDDQAILAYNKVIEQNPFLVEAYAERGKICFEHGNNRQAEDDMKKVLELNPQQMADVSGDYSAEGVEQQTKRAYSMMNPFGI